MAIITSTRFPAASRRSSVRENADITDAKYGDDDLDRRISHWDDAARAYFQVPAAHAITGEEPYIEQLILASNLFAAAALRRSDGGRDNMDAAAALVKEAKSIVASYNGVEEEQSSVAVGVTRGIDSGAYHDRNAGDAYDPDGRGAGVGTFS